LQSIFNFLFPRHNLPSSLTVLLLFLSKAVDSVSFLEGIERGLHVSGFFFLERAVIFFYPSFFFGRRDGFRVSLNSFARFHPEVFRRSRHAAKRPISPFVFSSMVLSALLSDYPPFSLGLATPPYSLEALRYASCVHRPFRPYAEPERTVPPPFLAPYNRSRS